MTIMKWLRCSVTKNEIYRVTLKSWEKYNGKRQRGHKCVLISDRFLDDAKVAGLPPTTKLLFLACILAGSESNSGLVEVSSGSLLRQSGIRYGSVRDHFDRLQSLQLLTYEVLESLLEKSRVEKRRVDSSPPKAVVPVAHPLATVPAKPRISIEDLEAAYANYPRKDGKKRGMLIARRDIKTPEDLELLKAAIARYRRVAEDRGDPQYVKHFSTFMGEWKDWLDPQHGQVSLRPSGGSSFTGFADV